MIKQLHNSSSWFWLVARVLLAALLVWHTGFAPGLHSGRTRDIDNECGMSCPCEESDISAAVQDVQHYESDLPQEHSSEHCAPDCLNCICCSGTISAVTSCYNLPQNKPPDETIFPVPAGEPANGPQASIYRPPRLSLS